MNGIRTRTAERLEAYLGGLPERRKRGILAAMLAFCFLASGAVLVRTFGRMDPGTGHMGLPFGEGCLTDTLRQVPVPEEGRAADGRRYFNPLEGKEGYGE